VKYIAFNFNKKKKKKKIFIKSEKNIRWQSFIGYKKCPIKKNIFEVGMQKLLKE